MKRKKDNHQADIDVRQICDTLAELKSAHPRAKIEITRKNSVSIRIRIIDPDFKGLDLVERDNQLWRSLEKLPEEILSQISLLLLLTPEETQTSFANVEFEHSVPSNI
jgi:hypothetical protein